MFRLFGLLLGLPLSLGIFVTVDYTMSSRWSGREDGEGLTFTEYLAGYTGGLVGGGGAAGLPNKLVEMLPRAPEGWTVRPTEPGDIDGFLPKDRKSVPKDVRGHIEAMVKPAKGRSVETAALTYERGERKVIFQAVRYPDVIFTSFMAMTQRFELQMRAAEFSGTEFMTVRGLDVEEDLLPDEVNARLFLADVGGQIHLRVLAPERMKDQDLVPFFQTLHVEAMNASVVDKQTGLGKVPVIVLASVLDAATRAAYDADIAEREAILAAEREAQRLEDEARIAAAEAEENFGSGFLGSLFGRDETVEPEDGQATGEVSCTKGIGGSKRCTVTGVDEPQD
ncbi:hypothetical protein [Tabrizicola aquatica]|uniref:hypothetical protein n=1 Tax=Tabrizicola aquatica TaxID=909926 RepID=UPI0011AED643|nr:hypothetical protein [Tabrizicola aquatica]